MSKGTGTTYYACLQLDRTYGSMRAIRPNLPSLRAWNLNEEVFENKRTAVNKATLAEHIHNLLPPCTSGTHGNYGSCNIFSSPSLLLLLEHLGYLPVRCSTTTLPPWQFEGSRTWWNFYWYPPWGQNPMIYIHLHILNSSTTPTLTPYTTVYFQYILDSMSSLTCT